MAQIRNYTTEVRWRGFASGLWGICDVDFDSDECVAAAALASCGARAAVTLPPPANVVIAAILASLAGELYAKRGENGVTIHLEVLLHSPGIYKKKITKR